MSFLLRVGFLFLALSAPTLAAEYPGKPIRIVTGAAGGGSDASARQIAQAIAGPLGQPVVVENRSVVQAAEAVAKAPPDGYTLIVLGTSLWLGPLLQKMPYDPVADFAPVSPTERTVFLVAVHPSLPVKSIGELIRLAKAKPGALNFGLSTPGSVNHLAGELFKSMTGVNIVNLTYKGSGPVVGALLSGEAQLTILDAGLLAPHVKSARLRALAVTSAEPSALTPGLPTVAASGLPGYEMVSLTGVLAPAKTPAAIITRLNQEMTRFLSRTEVKERYLSAGSEIVLSSPEQFAATIRSDMSKLGKVIRDAGIKLD